MLQIYKKNHNHQSIITVFFYSHKFGNDCTSEKIADTAPADSRPHLSRDTLRHKLKNPPPQAENIIQTS